MESYNCFVCGETIFSQAPESGKCPDCLLRQKWELLGDECVVKELKEGENLEFYRITKGVTFWKVEVLVEGKHYITLNGPLYTLQEAYDAAISLDLSKVEYTVPSKRDQ